MRIDAIEVYRVAMPLISPWRTAYGEDATVESVLVRMWSGEEEGWGESTPLAAPCYSPEFAAGVYLTVKDWLAPRIVGQEIPCASDLQALLATFKGNPFAKGALDTAWWALESQLSSRPLHRLFGATRDEVVVGADFGVLDSIDELLVKVGQAVDQGFPRVKLKFRPGWDLDMLAAVRQQHPKLVLHIDCNSGYTLDDLDLFRKIDRFDLAMIEQPLRYDDLVDHAKLARSIETPICLDESINSLDRTRQALDLECCRYVNIKPGRVGGITVAIQIHDLCAQAGVPCWVGGMLESSLGSSFCVALAMLDNFTYPADVFPSSRFFTEDLAEPDLQLCLSAGGTPSVRASSKAGNPSVPVPSRLDACTIERIRLGQGG
ncbi:MAG: o-succinylbenzoate synthase [Planctomycetota bacterium]